MKIITCNVQQRGAQVTNNLSSSKKIFVNVLIRANQDLIRYTKFQILKALIPHTG
jgi:hypothetical protein